MIAIGCSMCVCLTKYIKCGSALFQMYSVNREDDFVDANQCNSQDQEDDVDIKPPCSFVEQTGKYT